MEDRHVVSARVAPGVDRILYAVFDGHGGAAVSQYCAERIAPTLAGMAEDLVRDPLETLRRAFLALNRDVLTSSAAEATGSTALVVVAGDPRGLAVAHAGDSRAIVVRKDGSWEALTRDHKPDVLAERERVVKAGGRIAHWGGWRVEGWLSMTRCMGNGKIRHLVTADPDTRFLALDPATDAFVLLATDGLWEVIRNDEAAAIVAQKPDAMSACGALAEELQTRGIVDNTTCVCLAVQ